MKHGVKQQRGAALVIVLALLTGALVVGVSGMQSSLIDERLAGNYRASAQAQMNAEQAAAQALQKLGEYDAQVGKDNLDELGLDETSSFEDVKQLRYDDVDGENLTGKESGECTSTNTAEDKCFYFPLAIDDDKYWAAFGAVIKEGEMISQHVVLVKLAGVGAFPGVEIAEKFNNYGVLSGDEVDIEKNFTFWGKARAHGDMDEEGITCGGEDVANCLEGNKGVTIPSFNFDSFMESMKKRYPLGDDVPKNSGCDIESSRMLNSETQYCADQVDVNGSASISDSTVYFNGEVDFDGGLVVRHSTLYFANDVDFNGSLEVHDARLVAQGQMDINGAVSGSEITLVSHNQLDIFGSVRASDSVLYAGTELDIFGSVDMTNSSVAAKDQLDTEGGLALTNVAIVVDDEINITSKYGPVLNNVLVMAKDQLDVDLEREARVDRGWFYSGGNSDDDDADLDMDIKKSTSMVFCGGLMAQGDVDFDAAPSIKRFNSAGQGGCPEFEPFDDPRGGSGELKFDEWK